jgi:hypothetical protein
VRQVKHVRHLVRSNKSDKSGIFSPSHNICDGKSKYIDFQTKIDFHEIYFFFFSDSVVTKNNADLLSIDIPSEIKSEEEILDLFEQVRLG